ncbi:MAG: hypothetical protein WA440_00515, partial [Ignavibacteriaceae bacterium]
YNALGNVLFSLAFFYWFSKHYTNSKTNDRFSTLKLLFIVVGGIGFLLTFYVGGADSIPRRYSDYPEAFTSAKMLATIGAAFASVYLIGIFILFVNISNRCLKILFSRS